MYMFCCVVHFISMSYRVIMVHTRVAEAALISEIRTRLTVHSTPVVNKLHAPSDVNNSRHTFYLLNIDTLGNFNRIHF